MIHDTTHYVECHPVFVLLSLLATEKALFVVYPRSAKLKQLHVLPTPLRFFNKYIFTTSRNDTLESEKHSWVESMFP